MSNRVKWTDWCPTEANQRQPGLVAAAAGHTARLQLLGCGLGLAALAVVLPGPANWVDLLGASTELGFVSMGATVEAAILVTAGLLVWALSAWVLAVWLAAVAGRLPGAPGRCARHLLRMIAPAAVGRIIAAAVGVSLLAGTSACAVPAMATLGSGSATEVVADASTSTSVPLGGGTEVVEPSSAIAPADTSTAPSPNPWPSSGAAPGAPTPLAPSGDVITSITIDWPVPPIPASSPGSPHPSDPSAPARDAGVDPTLTIPTDAEPVAPVSSAHSTAPNSDDASATDQLTETEEPVPGITDAPPVDATSGPPDAPRALPDDPTVTGTLAPPHPPPATDESAGVQVKTGDTLWSIACHHLSPDATDAEIDTAWRAWYSANVEIIGDDPDRITPGQLLHAPDPETGL